MAGLRQQIVVPTVVLAATIGATLAVLGWQARRDAAVLERQIEEVRAASGFAIALTHASEEEQRWMLGPRSPGYEIALRMAGERISDLVAQVTELRLGPRGSALWERYRNARKLMLAATDEVVAATRRGDEREAALAIERWRLASEHGDALLTTFELYHVRLLEQALSDLLRRREETLAIAGVAVLVGLAIAALFSALLARAVVRPIAAMSTAAQRITELGHRAPVEGADRLDEIGVLARSFNAMTERLTAANARLAEAVRARDEFISLASHELKTPLTPMKLQLQTLLRAARRDPDAELDRDRLFAATERFEKLVGRVGALVDSMLDVSRLGAGKLALRREPASVPRIVQDAVERVADEVRAAGSTVQVETGGCDELVPVDRQRLEQVIVNLVLNAARYAPGSPIIVRCGREEGGIRIEVEDRGPGIDPSDHERIFNRFERAVEDPLEKSGLGLGLYIAREIVRAHGGELSVRSAPGRGATFVVQLPVQ